MIYFDQANVFHKKRGRNYHTINHTIIRVNGLIVTQNLYFLKELITALSFHSREKKENKTVLSESVKRGFKPLVIFLLATLIYVCMS